MKRKEPQSLQHTLGFLFGWFGISSTICAILFIEVPDLMWQPAPNPGLILILPVFAGVWWIMGKIWEAPPIEKINRYYDEDEQGESTKS
jgi:hypothetical protein